MDVALVAALFWFKSTVSVTFAVIAGLLIVALLAVAASQAFASTPAITGSDGKPLANSIATLEKVNLNGSEQWISIRGKDANSPVLLFLAGGPGGSQLATARHALGGLEEHFVIVFQQLWDVDLRKQAAHLEVPVYFLIGRHDVNAPTALTEEYYDLLSAPHKELVWFERSGHTPWTSESGTFVDEMVNRVLGQTLAASAE